MHTKRSARMRVSISKTYPPNNLRCPSSIYNIIKRGHGMRGDRECGNACRPPDHDLAPSPGLQPRINCGRRSRRRNDLATGLCPCPRPYRSGPAIHLTRGAGAVPSRTWRRWCRCNSTPMAVADAASSWNPRAAPRISFYCPLCSINDLACEADVVLGPLR